MSNNNSIASLSLPSPDDLPSAFAADRRVADQNRDGRKCHHTHSLTAAGGIRKRKQYKPPEISEPVDFDDSNVNERRETILLSNVQRGADAVRWLFPAIFAGQEGAEGHAMLR